MEKLSTVGHLINGKKIEDTQRTQAVYNPSNGIVSKQVALASKQTVEEPSVPHRLPFQHGKILRHCAVLV